MSPALSLHLLHVTPVVAIIKEGFDIATLTPNPEVSAPPHLTIWSRDRVMREAKWRCGLGSMTMMDLSM
jgi:hypothetical protein